MQIEPQTSEKYNEIVPIDKLISSLGFIQNALFVSISYYAIATEMRLLNSSEGDVQMKGSEI